MTESQSCCPLCGSTETDHYHSDQRREYRQCHRCELVFVPPQFHLSPVEEKAQYDFHNNSPDDPGYRKFLSRIAEPLCQRIPGNSQGLDFGCGPGPTLSVMMEERGHQVALYDIYYRPDSSVLERQYHFVTATEVVEHLSSPGEVFNQLWSLLQPGGVLGLMTKLVTSPEAFASWHYKLDPTHICFFSRETFAWLGEQWGSEPEFIWKDVIFFR